MTSRPGASIEWKLLPYFVLRMAGFPFCWLDILADQDVTVAARELLACERETDRAVQDATVAARALPTGQRGSRPVKRLLRVMQRRLPPTRDEAGIAASVADPGVVTLYAAYCRAWAAENAAQEVFAQAHDAALYRAGVAALRLFHTEPLLRDMLLISNADAFEPLTQWADSRAGTAAGDWWKLASADRAKLDILARYLQRACAKNDTHSHFGPFAPGVFDPGVEGIRWRAIPLRRYPRLSRWAAEALLAKFSASADRAALLAPRRAPGAIIRDGSLEVLDFDYSVRREDVRDVVQVRPAVPAGPAEQAVFAHCDGEHTVAEVLGLARQDGLQLSQTELLASLEWLASQGAVVLGPEFPVGVEDALTVLREFADRAADTQWRATLDGIQAALDELATGEPPARVHAVQELARAFTSETGLPPSRNKGRFYGDRSVFYEECTSWCGDLAAGRPVTELLSRDLAPVYDLFMLRPRVRFLEENQIVADWFRRRFGAGARVGALDYLRAYLADAEQLAPGYAAVERKVAETGQRADALLLPPAPGRLPIRRVDEQFFAAAIEALSQPVPALCNPDVMLVAPSVRHLREGRYQAIIGDLHAVEEVISHQTFAPFMEHRFADYGDTIIAAYQRLLAEDEEIVDVMQRHHNKAYIQTALPCRDVEAWGRSPKKRPDVLALADLTVVDAAGGLRLAATGNGRFLRLMALPFGQLAVRPNPFAVFSFPRTWGDLALQGDGCAHLPRLEVGRVIVQRELWRVPASALSAASDRAAFLGVQRLREELSLPRHVYAKLPHETKPVYCDLNSPLLVRQLARMASAGTGTVQLTEMLPAPSDLWLEEDGQHYTTEIRFAVTSSGGQGGRPGS